MVFKSIVNNSNWTDIMKCTSHAKSPTHIIPKVSLVDLSKIHGKKAVKQVKCARVITLRV